MITSFFTILILLVCVLLALVVLVQNSKGGGLASGFSSSNQIMGVRKTADFLEKATWSLVIALFAFCMLSTAFIPKRGNFEVQETLEIQDQLDQYNLPPGSFGTPPEDGATDVPQ